MLPKKRIQVVMVDENGVERVVSTDDEPLKVDQFGSEARGIIHNEALSLGERAAASFKMPAFRAPQIIDNPMRRSAGGIYKPLEHTIYMNMLIHHDPTNYRATLIHEMAHAVVTELARFYQTKGQRVFGPRWKAHGLYWQVTMERMGVKAEAYHRLDIVKEMPEKYVAYLCPCGYRHQVGKRKVKNAIAKGAKWSCKRCNRAIDMTRWSSEPAAMEQVAAAAGGKRRHARPSSVSYLVRDVGRMARR